MNNLKKLREEKKLSQHEVANFLKITQVGYFGYEKEKRDIPTNILIKLADYFNTSIDYILCRTNEKKPYPKINNKD